ncbi:MAG TPA: shikimate kinase [Pseudogracilibacillus sp.]|nr:shikimate kinase [Pseudogracilibacillus sp.]
MTKNIHSIQEKSIAFIGFMGVGKTTIAQKVASKLFRDFVDIDEEIEKEFGMPTTDIFKQYGEAFFREKEKEYVIHYCQQPLKVISLGGGAFLQEEVKEACLKHSIVIYLDMSWEAWIERLPLLIDSRPILQSKSLDEIQALFESRKKIYEQHDSKVVTDNASPEDIANTIIDSMKLAWELHS